MGLRFTLSTILQPLHFLNISCQTTQLPTKLFLRMIGASSCFQTLIIPLLMFALFSNDRLLFSAISSCGSVLMWPVEPCIMTSQFTTRRCRSCWLFLIQHCYGWIMFIFNTMDLYWGFCWVLWVYLCTAIMWKAIHLPTISIIWEVLHFLLSS